MDIQMDNSPAISNEENLTQISDPKMQNYDGSQLSTFESDNYYPNTDKTTVDSTFTHYMTNEAVCNIPLPPITTISQTSLIMHQNISVTGYDTNTVVSDSSHVMVSEPFIEDSQIENLVQHGNVIEAAENTNEATSQGIINNSYVMQTGGETIHIGAPTQEVHVTEGYQPDLDYVIPTSEVITDTTVLKLESNDAENNSTVEGGTHVSENDYYLNTEVSQISSNNATLIQENFSTDQQIVHQDVLQPFENVERRELDQKLGSGEVIVETGEKNEIVVPQSGQSVTEYTILEPVAEYSLSEAENIEQQVVETHEEEAVVVENQITEVEQPPPKPARGRKRTSDIPLHILGHNIDKPAQDVPNGKPVLKPRLGVKIPYRNLTSQIVSKQELQHEIIERAKQKQANSEPLIASVQFAKKLTQRLAKKIAPSPNSPKLGSSNLVIGSKEGKITVSDASIPENSKIVGSVSALTTKKDDDSNKPTPMEIVEDIRDKEGDPLLSVETLETNIQGVEKKVDNLGTKEDTMQDTQSSTGENNKSLDNNSDLIAMLEGDGDDHDLATLVPKVDAEDRDAIVSDAGITIKELEKEIALKQLRELPATTSKNRFFKNRDGNTKRTKSPEKYPVKKDESQKAALVSREKSPAKKEESQKPALASREKSTKKEEFQKSVVSSGEKSSIKEEKSGVKKEELQKDSSLSAPSKAKSEKGKLDKFDEKSKSPNGKAVPVEVEPQLNASMVIKTYTRKRRSTDVALPSDPPKKLVINQSSLGVESTEKIDFASPTTTAAYITKSSRIIKKKVIWDPDATPPPLPKGGSKIPTKIDATPSPKTPKTVTDKKPVVLSEKKIDKEKKPIVEKEKKPTSETETKITSVEKEKKIPLVEKEKKTEIQIEKSLPKGDKEKEVAKSPDKKSVVKKIIKGGLKKPKRLTEVDKLLMDEGAVNMIYDVNTPDDQKTKKKNQSVISLDRVQKELHNKTKEIKNELQNTSESPTKTKSSLRKKESLSPFVRKEQPARKMSKDSTKSSVHSPPASPTFAEASRIIRRHSSSSFSGADDGGDEDSSTEDEPIAKLAQSAQKKKAPLNMADSPRKKLKKDAAAVEAEQKDKPETPPKKNVKPSEETKSPKVESPAKNDRAFTVTKVNAKHIVIDLNYAGIDCYLTVQMLRDLTNTLKDLGKNKDCSIVSINSLSSAFCLGIDYKGLVEASEDLRRKRAVELSSCIREFLKCLLNFPKVLVAGIQGDCVGLGVTMLPLFDMIIASDKASFRTPYSKLGCCPEGGFLLTVPFITNHGLASELLFTSQKVTADDAYRRGLITKLFWPEKYDEEFKNILNVLTQQSKQSVEATKKQLRQNVIQQTETSLTNQTKTLIEHWISAECQKNFANYSASKND